MDNFKLRICSDFEHEKVVVDICFENNTVATINQDKGLEELVIEIFPPPNSQQSWVFSHDKFMEYLKKAKNTLKEMQ